MSSYKYFGKEVSSISGAIHFHGTRTNYDSRLAMLRNNEARVFYSMNWEDITLIPTRWNHFPYTKWILWLYKEIYFLSVHWTSLRCDVELTLQPPHLSTNYWAETKEVSSYYSFVIKQLLSLWFKSQWINSPPVCISARA